jgi:hypothetical protein
MQFHGQDIGHGSGFGGAFCLPLLATAWHRQGLLASFHAEISGNRGLN